MVVAPVSTLRFGRDTGMLVDMGSSMPLQASCVLSLVAHTGRSILKDLPGGNKVISKGSWNVPFEDVKTEH